MKRQREDAIAKIVRLEQQVVDLTAGRNALQRKADELKVLKANFDAMKMAEAMSRDEMFRIRREKDAEIRRITDSTRGTRAEIEQLKQQRDEWKRKVTNAMEEKNRAEAQLYKSNDKIRAIREEFERNEKLLKDEQSLSEKYTNELKEKNKKLRKQYLALEQRYLELDSGYRQTIDTLEESQRMLEEKDREKADLAERLENLRKSKKKLFEETRDAGVEHLLELDKIKLKLHETLRENDALVGENQELKEQLERARMMYDEAVREAKQLRVQMQKKEQELQDTLDRIQEEWNAKKREMEQAFERQKAAFLHEKGQLESKMAEMQRAQGLFEGERREWQEYKARLEAELGNVRAAYETSQRTVEGLIRQEVLLKNEIGALREKQGRAGEVLAHERQLQDISYELLKAKSERDEYYSVYLAVQRSGALVEGEPIPANRSKRLRGL